jgi:Rrf2 family protein
MMKFSTKSRYALRLMADLAVNGQDKNVSLREISERQGISMKYLEQITGLLCKAGMIKSTRGARGGYRLARGSETYSVWDVLEITEGGLAPVPCLEKGAESCPHSQTCETVDMWAGLYQMADRYLKTITIRDLAERLRKKEKRQDVWLL